MSARHHVKTAAEVRAEFAHRGQTITVWAREHGYTPSLVFEVLRGTRIRGTFGKSHEIAVLLGLKKGVIERRDRKDAA